MRRLRTTCIAGLVAILAPLSAPAQAGPAEPSVARQWNEAMLSAIRMDFARPTIHARNLYHTSVAMWDAWAVYDTVADPFLSAERLTADDVQAARNEAISFAAYRVLKHRFARSPGADVALPAFDALMDALGYDKAFDSTVGDTPAAVGNRCAENVITYGLTDGSNEAGGYVNLFYEPVNPPLLPDFPGNPKLLDVNRWQPLALEWFKDQAGIEIGEYPEFLSPEWGQVTPFSLTKDDLTIYTRDGFDYWVYHDPGPPPQHGADDYYKWGFEQVSIWSSHLDPADGVMWDVSPASIGNAPLPDPAQYADYYDLADGGDWGTGYDINPVTGKPYEPQLVPRGDYARILAEFWADGPDSETPPGHWFVLLNYVSDHPLTTKQLGGAGPVLDDLEWDVKTYLAMGGAMHDVAIASWGVKGWYDYLRPISAIRWMADQGQSSDPDGPSYDPAGVRLHDGLIEVVTVESSLPGERHEHLIDHVGKIAIFAWRGHTEITDPDVDTAGVGWILAENWWPYQRPTFVTPPFAGYVSGHSTYSRAAAELMTLITGSPYFPGGLGEFPCPQNDFLVFEEGPSVDVTLQWAKYNDASDQCSLSRIWGGIHPGADDLPGRIMGSVIGPEAFDHAVRYYNGQVTCPGDLDGSDDIGFLDLLTILSTWGPCTACAADLDGSGAVDFVDLLMVLSSWGPCS
ncbi:MAG: vanadium-dependent haloperoxidase [Phycisphaerales bacterium]|nr:vanadium-dependent haloperoxidase [Phycisphaerales bacterium]NNM25035.1 vanadium-dependent haloperoxidase [Phycisphaerales bacterium]